MTNLSDPCDVYEGTYPVIIESTWTERANKERERCLCDCDTH